MQNIYKDFEKNTQKIKKKLSIYTIPKKLKNKENLYLDIIMENNTQKNKKKIDLMKMKIKTCLTKI